MEFQRSSNRKMLYTHEFFKHVSQIITFWLFIIKNTTHHIINYILFCKNFEQEEYQNFVKDSIMLDNTSREIRYTYLLQVTNSIILIYLIKNYIIISDE